VSGGADSTALALLADRWARARGGAVLALVVDHGLRPESGAEAALTVARLLARGIEAECLVLRDLRRGPALAERARAARHQALAQACRRHAILHLLLGHHAADQAETLEMRAGAGSGPAGLSGMAALREVAETRILRPLLTVPPGRLRDTLRAAAMEWVEDPSNADPASLRVRLRQLRADPLGEGATVAAAVAAAALQGAARARQEAGIAEELAARARILPEGYAVLTAGRVSVAALAALLRVIGGRPHAPAGPSLQRLADNPRPATLGGVRLLPAGRAGPAGALLVVRELRAMAPPVPVATGATWDGRFRVIGGAAPVGATLGAVGPQARRLRASSTLPAAVLATLPAIRIEGDIVAVPHLDGPAAGAAVRLLFSPPVPAACAVFRPAGHGLLASRPPPGEAC
jgi:tRNA(Ile)-lysidine synthase